MEQRNEFEVLKAPPHIPVAFPWRNFLFFIQCGPDLARNPRTKAPLEDGRLESPRAADIVRATLRLWHGKILNLQAVASLEKELEETDRS